MSKERARRRAEREAAHAALLERRARQERRRRWWRSLRKRLAPRPGRRAWGLGRRSVAQRSLLAGAAIGLMWIVWHFVDDWPLRIGFWLLILLCLPVLAVLAFDRKGMRL